MADPGDDARPDPWSRVIVMPMYGNRRRDEAISSWHALWEGDADPTRPLGEFDGSREDALAWARGCNPTTILVFDLETRDLRPAH